MNERWQIKEAIEHLKWARKFLVSAKAPNAAEKVRRALTSAQGALRNADVHRNDDPATRLRRGAAKRKAVR